MARTAAMIVSSTHRFALAMIGIWGTLVAGTGMATAADTSKRPNILWLVAEDFSPHLGCYGEEHVWTPNLDLLAAQGVRYNRAFTTAPVCSASRSAFMTGMYQTTIGAHHHRSHRDDGHTLPDGVRVITDWLRDAGYFTANVVDFPEGFGFNGSGKTDWNFTYDGKPFDSREWSDLAAHQPFFAQVNFQETHRVNSRATGKPWASPPHADPDTVDIPPIYPDHPITRQDWAGYLDAATALDRKIGRVLEQLHWDGLDDDTIVIFSADHGQAHVRGKQFCYDDGLRIPLIIRWPANFAAPAHYTRGSIDERLISSVDIAPTLLAIAGVDKPAKMQGQVFLTDRAEPARRYVFGARDRCDETTFRFRAIRDERYRYIRNFMPERPFLQANAYKEQQYPVWNLLKELDAAGQLTGYPKFLTAPSMPAEELYDMQADPWSMTNLVGSEDSAHQAALARLRDALDAWIIESDDQGRFPEPPEVAAARGATKRGTKNPNLSSPSEVAPSGGKKKRAKAAK